MGIKIKFVLFERTFKIMCEDPLQFFRTLLGFRNILTKNSMQSPSWYYNYSLGHWCHAGEYRFRHSWWMSDFRSSLMATK